jgi:hypothetical protein
MKKILMCIFLIGLFAFGCTSPPDWGPKQTTVKTEWMKSFDQAQSPVIYNFVGIGLPLPDKPLFRNQEEKGFMEIAMITGVPINHASGDRLATARHVNQLAGFIPDKSLKEGTLTIRDKL